MMDDREETGATANWKAWCRLFGSRKNRELPALDGGTDYAQLPRSVARSLAIFQLGESGGGTIVEQARNSRLAGIDDDYVTALAMFVDEEHRHANILAMCVRLMKGTLIRQNWTARLFVFGRRLIGLRLKVLVLLAAEVVGICYYSLIADRLPPGPMRVWLRELVDDERSHLAFHCDFLRRQTQSRWKRAVFVATWRAVMLAAAGVVMFDHRKALSDLQVDPGLTWQRWMAIADQAERFITEESGELAIRNILRDHQATASRILDRCYAVEEN